MLGFGGGGIDSEFSKKNSKPQEGFKQSMT